MKSVVRSALVDDAFLPPQTSKSKSLRLTPSNISLEATNSIARRSNGSNSVDRPNTEKGSRKTGFHKTLDLHHKP